MAADLHRYHRQMLLPGFGEAGQRRLLGSTALVAGCGALGTVIAETLCRAGVGRLVIVDRDFVEWTNLQRQVLFDEADAAEGLPKAVAAKRKLRAINGQVRVDALVTDLHAGNAEAVAGVVGGRPRIDVIVDGLDNFETRYLLNDLAVKHGVPYIYGGAVGTVGAAMAILPHTAPPDVAMEQRTTPWEKRGIATPDLRDLFEVMPPPGSQPTCDTAGVLAPVVQMVAAFEGSEALKVLLGRYEAVSTTMLHVDLERNHVRQFNVAGAYETSSGVCSKQRRFEYLDGAESGGANEKTSSTTSGKNSGDGGGGAVTLCGRGAVQVKPAGSGAGGAAVRMDLAALGGRFAVVGRDVVCNEFLVRAVLDDAGTAHEVTVFEDGRAIIKGTTQPEVARRIYAKYVGA